tara:strand:+ start:3371 stop:3805 length:435 start_codon:yes stop_codon:yes gene_type:complete
MTKTQTSSSRLTTLAKKNIQEKLSLTTDGIVQEGMGDIYVSVDVVSGVTLAETETSFIDSVTPTTEACENCPEIGIVTGISTHSSTAVSGITFTKTTEEHLMPLICTDSYGNFQKVVRTSNVDDTIEDLFDIQITTLQPEDSPT